MEQQQAASSEAPAGAGLATDVPVWREFSPVLDRASAYAAASATGELGSRILLYAFLDSARWGSGTPEWVGEVLANRIAPQQYAQRRFDYLKSREIDPPPPDFPADKLPRRSRAFPSPNVRRMLEEAATLARRTGDSEVHARHLLAALLREVPGDPPNAHAELRALGCDPSSARAALLDYLRGWQPTFGILATFLAAGRDLLPAYDADQGGDRDLLGIDTDVNAFARLIAAREMIPPLSIGLFGEWGSGKTFFMRRLRAAVAGLSHQARASGRAQRDLPFYKRIAQVEFNAWHYSEGNLWASLVEHIFSHLDAPGGGADEAKRLRIQLLKQVGAEEAAERAAEQGLQAAAAAVQAAEDKARVAEAARMQAERDRERLTPDNVRRLTPLPEVASMLGTLLTMLHVEKPAATAQELEKTLRQTGEDLRGAAGFARSIWRARDRWLRLTVLAIGIGLAVLAAVAPSIGGWLAHTAPKVVAWAGSALTLLLGLLRQLHFVRTARQEVERVQAEYDRRIEQEQKEAVAKVQAAQDEVARLRVEHEKARQVLEEAAVRLQAARERATDPEAHLLASFVQERAASTDYRKHLGVVALVREDFEKLSNYIATQNARFRALDPGEDPATTDKYLTPEQEDAPEARCINRIVLYIDDLDRCPPAVVVQVLQAVHLLLAFPVFVVVVGVDARWVKRSLHSRYSELLHADGAAGLGEDDPFLGSASAADYLEKIFQIPFWLRPLDPHACNRMIDALLAPSLLGEAQPTEGGGNHMPGENAARGAGNHMPGEKVPRPGGNHFPGEGGAPAPEADEISGRAMARLTVTEQELQYIHTLAPLLGRSPRALKRFLNVFRLLKAGLPSDVQDRFLGDGDYRLVLLLLALDAATGASAPVVFGELAAMVRDKKALAAGDLVSRLHERLENGAADRLEGWARTRTPPPDLSCVTEAALSTWLPRVRRFSFTPEDVEAMPLAPA